jgi:hypothetical protein
MAIFGTKLGDMFAESRKWLRKAVVVKNFF